jgi:hypothetical protein
VAAAEPEQKSTPETSSPLTQRVVMCLRFCAKNKTFLFVFCEFPGDVGFPEVSQFG